MILFCIFSLQNSRGSPYTLSSIRGTPQALWASLRPLRVFLRLFGYPSKGIKKTIRFSLGHFVWPSYRFFITREYKSQRRHKQKYNYKVKICYWNANAAKKKLSGKIGISQLVEDTQNASVRTWIVDSLVF